MGADADWLWHFSKWRHLAERDDRSPQLVEKRNEVSGKWRLQKNTKQIKNSYYYSWRKLKYAEKKIVTHSTRDVLSIVVV